MLKILQEAKLWQNGIISCTFQQTFEVVGGADSSHIASSLVLTSPLHSIPSITKPLFSGLRKSLPSLTPAETGSRLTCQVVQLQFVSAQWRQLLLTFHRVYFRDQFMMHSCSRCVHVAPIRKLLHKLGVTYHQYADDTQLYTKLEVPVTACLATLQQCVTALHAWFS